MRGLLLLLLMVCSTVSANEAEWISLFNGKDLTGWKTATENPETFSVKDGLLVVNGNRCHLFYDGPVADANFKNFEWRCEVMLQESSNSGMYFHTAHQAEGWPSKGYEVQLNNTHGDPKKTGGLYDIADVMNDSPAEDNKWFVQKVTVQDKHIVVEVDGKIVTAYTEPDDAAENSARRGGRLVSSGTFALQGHDPVSVAKFRKIEVRILD